MMSPLPGAPMPLGPTGPSSPSSPNLGAQAEALAGVNQAVQLLTMKLPDFPVGSEEQKVVMKAITDLSKIVPPSSIPQGVEMSSIAKLQEQARNSAMLRSLLNASANPQPSAPAPAGPPGGLPGMI